MCALNNLKKEYPQIFDSCWAVKVPVGWVPILRAFCERVAPLIDSQVFQDFLERNGQMYVSVGRTTEAVYKAVDALEDESLTVCRICGEPGRKRGDLSTWRVLCDVHYEEALAAEPKADVIPFKLGH